MLTEYEMLLVFWGKRSDTTELGPRWRLSRRYWLVSRHSDSDVPMSTTLPILCSPSCNSISHE
jgi:hypothetical protein